MRRRPPYPIIVLWGFFAVISLGGASQSPPTVYAEDLLVCRGADGQLRNPDVGQDCIADETAYIIQAERRALPLPSQDNEPAGFEGTVAAHNAWRQAVGVPDLAWSNELATVAQEWADFLASPQGGCSLAHRPSEGPNARPFGENLFQAFSSPNPPQQTPKEVVDAWGNESQDYDADTHTCTPGAVCGHYTQIVWRATQFVGCGKAACDTNDFKSFIWACNYNPPGNFVGEMPF